MHVRRAEVLAAVLNSLEVPLFLSSNREPLRGSTADRAPRRWSPQEDPDRFGPAVTGCRSWFRGLVWSGGPACVGAFVALRLGDAARILKLLLPLRLKHRDVLTLVFQESLALAFLLLPLFGAAC